jgi:catechol 2,3-dioxygenase-like lactoylglutathione lyase family enzyme
MPIELDTMATYAIEFGLQTDNAQEALRFYRDTLGLKPYAEIFPPGCHVWGLRLGNSMIKILQDDVPPTARNPQGRALGYRYITLHVLNAAELVAECEAAGFEVITPASEYHSRRPGDPGCIFALVRDPDGNIVELSQGSPWVPPTEEYKRGEVVDNKTNA